MSEFLLPAKPDVEKLVLGAILIDGGRFPAIREAIDRETFTGEPNRVLWDCFDRLHARGVRIDRITTYHEAQEMRPGMWSLGDLADLDNDMPDVPALDGYLNLLVDVATRRKAILKMAELARSLADGRDTTTALSAAQRIAGELGTLGQDAPLLDVAALVDASGGMDALMTEHRRKPSIQTPFPALNHVFEGMAPGRLTILAARPGQGKTTLALQLAEHAAGGGAGVAFFSLEMGAGELLKRAACIGAQVNLQKLLRGYCTGDEESAVAWRMGALAQLPLMFADQSIVTVGGIRRALCRAKQPVGLVVVDYLQLLATPNRNRMRHEELGEVSRGLKLLAREMGVSVLALSQLTRSNEHEKRPPALRDLRESGSLEQDCDNAILVHHERPEGPTGSWPARLNVAKQRMGPTGAATLMWNGRLARFEDGGEAAEAAA